MEWHTNAAAEAIDTDQGHQRTNDLHILLGGQTGGQSLREPLARQPAGVRDHPMNHLHGGGGKCTEMVVLALERCWCKCLSTCLTERTVPGLPHFGRDGDALSTSPPRPRRRQALPEARVRRRKVVAHRHESSAVRDSLHTDLPFM